jgi:TonB-dependent starch-binding outer membrane protein SusC
MKTIYKSLLLFVLLLCILPYCYAQDLKVVKGSIKDKAGEGIPYANILIKNSIIGTIADVDGNFSLSLADANATLVVSSFGFQTQEVPVNKNNFLNITMEDQYSELDEAVVVGYGTLQKSVVTGAISSVKNKDFKDQPVVAIGNAIQGKLAGVNVVSPSGTPGAGLLFNIRGSFNPLYVVDGIPLLSENNSSLETSYDLSGNAVGRGQSVSSIADINPNDIESIEILKDASAASIYGARAANGVVLITTKRGNSERTEFGINQYVGIQERIRTINFLSSNEMLDLLKDGLAQDKAIYDKDKNAFDDYSDFDPRIFEGNFAAGFNTANNTIWLDEVLRRAPISNTEIYARGGSARTRFHISGNYFNQKGIVLNSGFERASARINLDHKVNDKFSLGNTLMLTRTNNQRSFNDNTYTGIITNALGASPFLTPLTEDGDYTAIDDNDGLGGYASWLSDNPVKSANEIVARTLTNRVLGSFFGEYKFSPNFRFRSSWSVDYTDMTDNQYFSPITYDAVGVNGRALFSNFKGLNWVAENYFAYNKTVALDHNFAVVVGSSFQEAKSRGVRFQGENFPGLPDLVQITSAGQVTKRPATNGALGLSSYYGRVNYDFKNKFIVATSFRIDGSSRFSAANRYATFASGSLGYRIISDTDNQSEALITDLKARVSYGTTGDQEIGDFSQYNYFGTGVYNGSSTLIPNTIANPNLTWQRNKILNAGVDFELKKGRVVGAIEGFLSNKSGLLFASRVPGTTGFANITSNAGTVQSKGIELTLNATVINRKHFRWNIASNASFIRNEYTELAEDDQIISAYSDIAPTHIVKVGYPVGTFWGVKYEGVDPETGDALFDDLDGNGVIDNDDAQIIGRAFPKVFGGVSTDFKYKRFDVQIASQFSLGNQVYNLIRPAYDNGGWAAGGWGEEADETGNVNFVISSYYANNSARMKDRWQKPGDITDVPRASLITQNYVEASSMYVEDASFLRIRTINIGYHIKHAKWFETGRLYLQVQNPFLFTRYSGFDPEVSSTGGGIGAEQTAGVDYGAYPQARTYTVGINMTF